MSHIFISYSRDDIAFARYVRALLENTGIPVWMDEKRLSSGMDWWDEIEANIDACSGFLVIMSPTARQSVFVRNEILRAIDQEKMLFPVLLTGKHFGMLAHVHYEDMRGGLNDTPSASFMRRLQAVCSIRDEQSVDVRVVHDVIQDVASDVILLKFAKTYHGADTIVKNHLAAVGVEIDALALKQVGHYQMVASEGGVAAEHVIFVGTEWLGAFGYRQVREFADRGMRAIAKELPDAKHITMTVHGVNSHLKLDESESLLAQMAGLMDVIQERGAPAMLERITIVERNGERVARLRATLDEYFTELDYAAPVEDNEWGYRLTFGNETTIASPDAGQDSIKPYAVAIFPDDKDLEDTFHYGIKRVVHSMGLLCERVGVDITDDETPLEETFAALMTRLSRARLVVCEVSVATPLLYLQMGYALGREIPLVLIAHDDTDHAWLPTMIHYDKIWQLEERLGKWIREQIE